MKQQNFVAKHCRTFNKATVQRDRTKYHRPSNNEDWREDVDFDEEEWGLQEHETPSISGSVYKSSFINTGDNYAFDRMRTEK